MCARMPARVTTLGGGTSRASASNTRACSRSFTRESRCHKRERILGASELQDAIDGLGLRVGRRLTEVDQVQSLLQLARRVGIVGRAWTGSRPHRAHRTGRNEGGAPVVLKRDPTGRDFDTAAAHSIDGQRVRASEVDHRGGRGLDEELAREAPR